MQAVLQVPSNALVDNKPTISQAAKHLKEIKECNLSFIADWNVITAEMIFQFSQWLWESINDFCTEYQIILMAAVLNQHLRCLCSDKLGTRISNANGLFK